MRNLTLLIFISIYTISFQSLAFLNCKAGDTETLTIASKLYTKMTKLYEAGAISKTELIRSSIFLNEAKLCTQTMTAKDFCHTIIPLLNEINSQNELDLGRSSPTVDRENLTLLAESKILCEDYP